MQSIVREVLRSESKRREVDEDASNFRRCSLALRSSEATIIVLRSVVDVTDERINDVDGAVPVVERRQHSTHLLNLMRHHLLRVADVFAVVVAAH